jgi:tetratricopeptide (TPR) repeat protein
MPDEVTDLRREANRALVRRDYERARALFRQVITAAPESFEGYLGLAKVLERVDDHRGIVTLLEPVSTRIRVAGISRALGDAYRVLAYRGDSGAVDNAIRHYEEYHRQRKDAVTLFYLGELYREKKRDYEKALDRLRQSWDADPGSREVWTAAIDCVNRLGRPDLAAVWQRLWREHSGEAS